MNRMRRSACPFACPRRVHISRTARWGRQPRIARGARAVLDGDAFFAEPTSLRPFLSDLIQLQVVEGSGLGWTARQPITKGTLLMVSRPLALEHSATADEIPEPSALVAQICASAAAEGSGTDRLWLDVLRGPGSASEEASAASSSAAPPPRFIEATLVDQDLPQSWSRSDQWRLEQAQRLLASELGPPSTSGRSGHASHRSPPPPPSSSAAASGAGVAAAAVVTAAPPLHRRAVALLVGANSYGSPCQDPPVIVVRRIPEDLYPGGHVGVFPWFSLLNHSCCANLSCMVDCDWMVVRASEDLQEGQQLTVSYIGARVIQPQQLRRQWLREQYGFLCRCPRCSFEAALPEETSQFMLQTYGELEVLHELASAALEKKDRRQAENVDRLLHEQKDLLYRRAERLVVREAAAGTGPEVRYAADLDAERSHTFEELSVQQLSWLEASFMGLTMMQLDLFLHDVDPEALSQAREVLASVAPGSDLHLSLAARAMMAAQALARALKGSREKAESTEVFQEATRSCYDAYSSRYGPVSSQMFVTLLAVSMLQRWPKEQVQLCLNAVLALRRG